MGEYRRAVYDDYWHVRHSGTQNITEGLYRSFAIEFSFNYDRFLPKFQGSAVLELGCGHGLFLYMLTLHLLCT